MPDCPKCGTYLEVSVSSTKRGVDVSLVYEVPPIATPAPSPAPENLSEILHRTAKVEPTRAVEAKGEVDKFGRKIIRRNNDILLVEVGNGWTVCKDNGTIFWGASGLKSWVTEQSPQVRSTNEYAHALKLFAEATAAASLELPAANPAASAKHDQFPMGAGDVTGPGESPWEAIGKLAGEIYELKREVAALKAVKPPYTPPLSGKFAPPN